MSSLYSAILESCVHSLVFGLGLVVIALIAYAIEWILGKFKDNIHEACLWLVRVLRITAATLVVLDCIALVWFAFQVTLHLLGAPMEWVHQPSSFRI